MGSAEQDAWIHSECTFATMNLLVSRQRDVKISRWPFECYSLRVDGSRACTASTVLQMAR